MAQLKKQVFELKREKLRSSKSIRLERISNEEMFLSFSAEGYKERGVRMTINEYKQFVKILNNSKFIYSNEDIL